MKVEQVGDEVIIRMKGDASSGWLKGLLDYLRLRELTANTRVPQEEVDELAREVKRETWEATKHLYSR